MRSPFVLLLSALAACAPDPAPSLDPGPAPPGPAPHVAVLTADGPVELASLQGRPVVIQFAPADDDQAWAALADALGDLEAAGATVLSVTVDGAEDEAAQAFGYRGTPLAVVVDGEGTIRGRATPESGDVIFALASPILAEADVSATVTWQGADTVDGLVAAGGVVVTTDPTPGQPSLVIDHDLFSAQDLPADLGTPLAFVGEGASEHAASAATWGYAAIFVADARGALSPVESALPRDKGRQPGRRGVRG